MKEYEIVIIGGGPAGLAAALEARKHGVQSILILERENRLGGILNQCIHNGFGLHTFQEELTGPEYAQRYITRVMEESIDFRLNTTVIRIDRQKQVTCVSREEGLQCIQAHTIILAMGCRERPRGALNIPGYRPAGIYSAGTAQRLVNIEGVSIGKEVVILGSGDIGLIMARRMTLEGAKVKVVAEIMPYSGGLKRNIVQCLDDFGIPLKLCHTVVEIRGKKRVEGVVLAQVDEKRRPIPGTEEFYSCDTLLLSVGLLPENELTKELAVPMDPVTGGPRVNERMETALECVFACGNVLHVHDLVDYVSGEAALAGKHAAEYLLEKEKEEKHNVEKKCGKAPIPPGRTELLAGTGVRYTVPQCVCLDHVQESFTVRFRTGQVYKNHSICVYYDGSCVLRKKKKIMAPGEMEQLVLKKESFDPYPDVREIKICVEEESWKEN
ncbi:MAG: FAD-dependent oxidoreductase [Candidatus Limivivens sp.]|nr:FAD-dependent oxidoreductase [Candidatus Limivivens sp.]